MSDEILMITTGFGDVAELGQGFVNRVDGERILLPLPAPCEPGEGVRFVVSLLDGTPAFAGAGRCVQCTDQGEAAPSEAERFEALIDSLQFDERSGPVYAYIVQVRQYALEVEVAEADVAVEADVDAISVAPAEDVAMDADADFGDSTRVVESAAMLVSESEADVASVAVDAQPSEAAYEDADAPSAFFGDGGADVHVEGATTGSPSLPAAEVEDAELSEPAYAEAVHAEASIDTHVEMPHEAPLEAVAVERVITQPLPSEPVAAELVPEMPSFPEAADPAEHEVINTGTLRRTGIATQFHPPRGERPTPSPASGLFRYGASLPIPPAPPRPGIDAARWVQPAARP